jgi:signal transduction histidine kinase
MEKSYRTNNLNLFRQTHAMLQCVKCSFSEFRHDMANSVNALNISVEYLNAFIDTEGDSDTADIIEASLAQLKEMKRALIPLQQYNSPPPFNMRSEKVEPIINEILSEVRAELKDAVELTCSIEPEVTTVYTNREAFIQAILIQLNHTVGVLLGCEKARIEFKIVKDGTHVAFKFGDNRTTTICGGNVAERSEIFSMREETLELYMCREIMARLNGTFDIMQEGTTGKVITLTLPEQA